MNFRLKRRAVSNNARDPGLMSGQAYFVPDDIYRKHVLKYADQEDVRYHFIYLYNLQLTSFYCPAD